MWTGVAAINKCEELKIKFPQTLQEYEATAQAFKGKSSRGANGGFVNLTKFRILNSVQLV